MKGKTMPRAVSRIDARTLSDWLRHNKAVLIDVREPHEYARARIPGAMSLPLSRLPQADLPDAEGREVVVCCASGARSMIAADRLLARHYGQVYNLDGGLSAWRIAGQEIDN